MNATDALLDLRTDLERHATTFKSAGWSEQHTAMLWAIDAVDARLRYVVRLKLGWPMVKRP